MQNDVSGVRPVRLAYVVSHPIQYQAPMLRYIAADPGVDLTVFFCSDFSLRTYQDDGFGKALTWDVPLTEGYRSVVLPRWRDTPNPGTFAPITRGILRALREDINGEPYDAVWVHGYSSINALHAILAAKLLGIPVLLRAEPWLSDRPRSRLKLTVKKLAFQALRWCTAAVLPIGTKNAEYWRHYFGPDFPAFPMPYAVDNDFFVQGTRLAAAKRKALQAEFALDQSRSVILFASKLQARKHCDDLLSAYLLLADTMPPEQLPHLLIVGDGEQMADLQRHVAAARATLVRFAGFRNQTELPRFFDLASVFVLPSRHEAWGLVVNEAMAAGLAVVVSNDVGCAADLVHDGDNGFVFPVGDVPALRQALAAALLPGEADAMGERSRERIAAWSFREDLAGLKEALAFVTDRAIASDAELQREQHAATQ